MARRFLMVLLAVGAVVGFGSGIHAVHRHLAWRHGGAPYACDGWKGQKEPPGAPAGPAQGEVRPSATTAPAPAVASSTAAPPQSVQIVYAQPPGTVSAAPTVVAPAPATTVVAPAAAPVAPAPTAAPQAVYMLVPPGYTLVPAPPAHASPPAAAP